MFTSCSQPTASLSLDQLYKNQGGSTVIAFIKAINNGEQIGESAIYKMFHKEMIERNSVEELIHTFDDIRTTFGQLTLYDVSLEQSNQYELLLKGKKDKEWIALSLFMDEKQPEQITKLMIKNTDKKGKSKNPILVPDKNLDFESHQVSYASVEAITQKADELAKTYMDMNWFSGVVMVAKDGIPLYHKAFGMADIENKIPNTTTTKFRIGSINKSFTTILVLQMMEKGHLSLNDKLEKFNLGFSSEIASQVTTRHLLNHTSGFGDIFIPEYTNNIRKYKDIDDILPLLQSDPLLFKPGENQRYSNYGYIILGAILEKISGQTFEKLLEKNILKPLNMGSTHYNIAENIGGEAKSYTFQFDKTKTDYTGQLEYCTPDGGMYSTTTDLLKFYQAFFYTEQLLSNKSKVIMANEFQMNSNGNWNELLQEEGGGIGDAGGGPGVSALAEIMFKDNYMLIVLCNTDHHIAEEFGLRLAKYIRGEKYKNPHLPVGHIFIEAIDINGMDYVKNNFESIAKENGVRINPMSLNSVGYALLQDQKIDRAIQIFTLNIQLYPDEANPYDSLAEAYLKKGEKKKAKEYYLKALEIDPGLPSAQKALKNL